MLHQRALQRPHASQSRHHLEPATRTIGKSNVLHQYTMAACKSQNEQELDRNVYELNEFLSRNKDKSIFTDVSVSGFPPLYDIFHLPFEYGHDIKFAQLISDKLFHCVYSKMQIRLSKSEIEQQLTPNTDTQVSVLQVAVTTRSLKNFNNVVSLLRSHGLLHVVMMSHSADEYMLLHDLLKNTTDEIFEAGTALLIQDSTALLANLKKTTRSLFNTLQDAIRSGKLKHVQWVVSQLERHDLLQQAFQHINSQGFMAFHQALQLEGPEADEIFKLITQKMSEDLISASLKQETADRYMSWQMAMRMQYSKAKVNFLLSELQKRKETLKQNLKNITAQLSKFGCLNQAYKNYHPIKVALTLALLEPYPELLDLNLCNVTHDRYVVVHHALSAKDESSLDELLPLLESNPTALEVNLKQRTTTGLIALNCAIMSKSPKKVRLILELLEKHPEARNLNLKNTTDKYFNVVHEAHRSSDIEIVRLILAKMAQHLSRSENKAILEQYNKFGFNAFDYAVNSGKLSIVESYINAVIMAFGDSAQKTLERLANGGKRFFTGVDWHNSKEQKEIRERVSVYLGTPQPKTHESPRGYTPQYSSKPNQEETRKNQQNRRHEIKNNLISP